MSKTKALSQPSDLFRSTVVRETVSHPIEAEGGSDSAGLMRSCSAITCGEALGHGMWIDQVFLEQVSQAINEQSPKMRFSHPSLSGDGLGKHLGRARNAHVEGNRVVFDAHFAKSAHKTPDGDLAEYVMELGREDPRALGFSIAFTRDADAINEFQNEHLVDVDGSMVFQSPDPKNENNLPHVRLAKLHAVDVVDEPAANPDGLFECHKRRANVVFEADKLMEYVVGMTDDEPELDSLAELNIHPTRIRGFFERFCAERNLIVFEAEEPTEEEILDDRRQAAEEYITVLGPEDGPKAFAAGKPLAESLHDKFLSLQQENEELKRQKEAWDAAGSEGVDAVEVEPDTLEPEELGEKPKKAIRFADSA